LSDQAALVAYFYEKVNFLNGILTHLINIENTIHKSTLTILTSHAIGYAISFIQTIWIVWEIRKKKKKD
jgi:hypothetical protein